MAGLGKFLGVDHQESTPEVAPAQVLTPTMGTFDIDAPAVAEPSAPGVTQRPPAQFSVFGTALPGTKAALTGRRAHPLTIKANENMEVTRGEDEIAAAQLKAISDATGLPANVIKNAHPSMLKNLLERPDVKLQLDREQNNIALAAATRRYMAKNMEVAAILRGDIPLMMASEHAMDVFTTQLNEPPTLFSVSQDGPFPLPKTHEAAKTVIEGIGAGVGALKRGALRQQSSAAFALATELLTRATDSGKTVAEIIEDSLINDKIALSFGPGGGSSILGELVTGTIPRLVRRAFTDEADAEVNIADALKFMNEAYDLMNKAEAQTRSGVSRQWLEKVKGLDKKPWNEVIPEFLGLIVSDPAGFTATSTELMLENAPILAAGATGTMLGGPRTGIAIATALSGAQERFLTTPEMVKRIKDDTGIDVSTLEGRKAFTESLEAQEVAKDFGQGRALPIMLSQAASFGLLSKLHSLTKVSKTKKFAGATASEAVTEFAGESGAMIFSGSEYILTEALLEATAGANPVSVSIEAFTAGAADFKDQRHAKNAAAWLKGLEGSRDALSTLSEQKLATASDVMADRMREDGIDHIFISAEELVKFSQDNIDVIDTLGLDASSVQQAADAGQFVEIDAATFVRHILGKDGFDALAKHSMFEIDGMTPQESDEYIASGAGEQIEKAITDKAMARITATANIDEAQLTKLNDDIRQIKEHFAAELNQIPQYAGRRADLFAQLTAQKVAVRAVRHAEETGQPVDAIALLLEDNLRIQGGGAVVNQAMTQSLVNDAKADLESAVKRRIDGEITQEQFDSEVSLLNPILPYENIPAPSSVDAMTGALKPGQVGRVGKGEEHVGQAVGLRLDIPAYTNHNVWVPTIHDPQGKPVAHESVAQITDATFTQPGDTAERKAAKVGTGDQNKSPFAQINGTLQSVNPAGLEAQAQAALADPAWTQVGYDPRRHSFFYDRETQQPVLSADEVIQIGPLVLAKNVVTGDGQDFLYQDAPAPQKGAETVGQFTADMDSTGFATVYGSIEAIRNALPDGIRGTVVPGGLRFTPNFSPRVIASLRGDETAFSRAGKVVDAQVRNGKFVGASTANDTEAKRDDWRKVFSDLALEGERGRFWYENSGAAVLEMTGGDVKEAKKFIALLAIYSPQAKVVANATFALRAWAQYKAGEPIKVKTAVQDNTATDVLVNEQPWAGEKTNNFYINLLREVDPTVATKQGATIDMWMMHAGGYNKTAANSSEYAFMENETNFLAKQLGWEPQQVQAAVWVAIKARMENDQVKKDTEKSSEEAGWITYKKGKKGKAVRVVKDEKKHFANWFQHGLAHKLTKQDTEQAKFDFSDGIVRHVGQVSWEAIPSVDVPSLGGIHKSTYKQRQEFQDAIQAALASVTGEDLLAQYLGILADGSIMAPGAWNGSVSPSTQNIVAMAPAAAGFLYYNTKDPDAAPLTDAEFKALGKVAKRPYEKRASIDPAQKQILDVYAAALALVLRQDGVGYHKPFFATSMKAANGVDFRIDKPVTPVQMKKLNIEFRKIMDAEGLSNWDEHVALISAPTGVRVIKITDTFMDNAKIRDLAEKAFSNANISDSVTIRYFAADGSLAYNNWKENPNGESFIQGISSAGRSDVLEWIGDVLAPRIDAVYKDFAEKYGWGAPGEPLILEQSGDGRGRNTGGSNSPLEGAPIIDGATGPDQALVAVAEQYAQSVGLDLRRQGEYVQVNEARATRIADAYAEMQHAPNDPRVQAAYQSMIEQTKAQYEALVAAGYSFTFFDGNTDPYDGNPWNAMRDLRANKTMAVYGTYDGYGEAPITEADIQSNPMLADTGLTWADQNGEMRAVTANDLFRAVHDAFGHGLEGAGFRARGEENAWQGHVRLFTGDAVGAITSETRGQNSWLNYGPHGEENQTAKVEGTTFAEQKTGLMPDWTWQEGVAPSAPDFEQTGARGAFLPSDMIKDQNGDPINLIQIFELGDASTFLHESGHHWLEQLASDARSVGGQFQKDWDTVRNWWGLRPLELREEAIRRAKKDKDTTAVETLQKMTEAQVKAYAVDGNLRGEPGATRYLSVAMHEQFARGVENYFATGQAPSLALADAFIAFASFIKSVYKRMLGQSTDVQFSDEVTDVIDRMLATDEEIAVANGQYELASLFDTAAEAGMSEQQFAAHQKSFAAKKARSQATQLSKHMKELQRERTKWWNEEREAKRDRVSQEVSGQAGYRLTFALTQQGRADGSVLDPIERLERMDKDMLEDLVTDLGLSLETMPRVRNRPIYAQPKKGDPALTDPGAVAAAFGYDDVVAMIMDLSNLAKYEDSVEAQLDAEMAAEHGSMVENGEQEAVASIHEDNVAQMLASELAALRTTEPAFKLAFIRAYANERIGRTAVVDMKALTFLSAERRHAKAAGRALKKGDRVEAYKHQFQRLVNHQMARVAMKAEKDYQKKTRYMRKFKNDKTKFPGIEADYVDRIKTLVAAYDFDRPVTERRRLTEELKAIHDFMVEKETGNDAAVMSVPAWLLERDTLENVRDMTYSQFTELHDSVKMLDKQGRLSKKIRVGNELRDRKEQILKLKEALAGKDTALVNRLRSKFASAPEDGPVATLYGGASLLANADAQLLKVEQLLESIDGEPLGDWHQTIYQPFADAQGRKNDMTKDVTLLIDKAMKNLPKEVRKGMGKRVDVGAMGAPGVKWTRGNLIVLALNTGNESNLEKTILGFAGDPARNIRGIGWNMDEKLIESALDQLSKEEWDFIQEIWDHAEKLWPSVEQIYRDENGVSPQRVDPRKISTRHGDYAGGYFPMMYDYSVPSDATANRIDQMNALEMMQSEVGRGSVNSSMTKGRTNYAAPIDLSIARVGGAFDNTIHFITHYEAVRNARKVMGDNDLRSELESVVGSPYAKEIDNWVSAIAANGGDRPPVTELEKRFEWLTQNTTTAVLGASYTTIMAQTFGLATSFDRLLVDTTYTPLSAAEAAADMAHGFRMTMSPAHVRAVFAMSSEMRHRLNSTDRDLSKALRKLAGKKDAFSRGKELSMRGIAAMQVFTVDIPTWTAAYNRALRDDPADNARAIKYADRVVRITQSGGGIKDLSAIQRQKGLMKGATMFYSFFSVLYGIVRGIGAEAGDSIKRNPVGATMRAATRVLIVLTLQEAASALLRGKLPDMEPEDEDKPGMVKFLATNTLLAATGTVPLVRDVISGALSDYGFSGSPVGMMAEAVADSFSQVSRALDEEDERELTDLELLKPLVLLFGGLTGAPAIQTNRIIDGIAAWFDDEYNWAWPDLVRGYDEETAERRD